MKKRIISLLLALTLLWTLALPAAAAGTYADVPARHWAAADVAKATQLGIFKGVGEKKFGLGRAITRAEFVTALVRFFGWQTATPGKASFSDVPEGRWYYSAVETALANGALAAAGPAFRPGDDITRAEMIEMLVRGLGYASLAGQAADRYDAPFSDVNAKKGFIVVASDMGIVSGVGRGRFDPNGAATREQAAAILMRAYDRLHAKSTQVESVGGGSVRVSVETPKAQGGAEVPITPLEPLLELYDALRTLRVGGQDMSRAVLCLTGGGVRTVVSNGAIVGGDTLTAEEVAQLLAGGRVSEHYSDRYESAYCIYSPNSYQTATVWYQSERSMAAKVQLARLFGVTSYLVS